MADRERDINIYEQFGLDKAALPAVWNTAVYKKYTLLKSSNRRRRQLRTVQRNVESSVSAQSSIATAVFVRMPSSKESS